MPPFPHLCQWNKKISELDTRQFLQGGNLIQSSTSKSTCRQASRYVVNYNTSQLQKVNSLNCGPCTSLLANCANFEFRNISTQAYSRNSPCFFQICLPVYCIKFERFIHCLRTKKAHGENVVIFTWEQLLTVRFKGVLEFKLYCPFGLLEQKL